MTTLPTTLNLGNRTMKLGGELATSELVKRELGLIAQAAYKGSRGAQWFVQFFANGTVRAINLHGCGSIVGNHSL